MWEKIISPQGLDLLKFFGWGILIFGLLAFVVYHLIKILVSILINHFEERKQWLVSQEADRQKFNDLFERLSTNMEAISSRANASMNSVTQALNEHTQNAATFHSTVNEAHKYQREEHHQMAENIIKMQARFDVLRG